MKWIALILLVGMLHTCGMTTVLYSTIFPVEYTVTSTAHFSHKGQTQTNTVVTSCKVIDQTRTLAGNYGVTVTGERHWVRFPDGAILVAGILGLCRWHGRAPEPGLRLTAAENRVPTAAPGVFPVHDSHAYYFDDVSDPGRLRIYSMLGLMAGQSELVRINPIHVAAGGKKPSHSIDAAFPWLKQAAHGGSWRDTFEQRNAASRPVRFVGLRANLSQLVGGSRCSGVRADEDGPVEIPPNSSCAFMNPCNRGNANTICGVLLGGLTATVEPSFTRIRFKVKDFETALRADLVREQRLHAAGAPGEYMRGEFAWSPEVCVDEMCRTIKLSTMGFQDRRLFYYPKQNRLLELFPVTHVASGSLFRAIPGPVYSGFD